MRPRDSTRCAISGGGLMASSMAVIPAPVTATGSKVPSGEACRSSGLGDVLPLRWFWALPSRSLAAASGAFPDETGCRGSSILRTRHSIQRLFSSRSSALQISKISRARMPSSWICFATTGGTYITRSPSSEYMTCSPYRPSTRFPSSQRRATSTGEFVLNRRIPFVIVVLLVPVLQAVLIHRLGVPENRPEVPALLPVPLPARLNLVAGVPAEWAAAIRACLERNPARRPQSAGEVEQMLRGVASTGRPISRRAAIAMAAGGAAAVAGLPLVFHQRTRTVAPECQTAL